MFLAIKEIKHAKVHYGLIIAMVTLIGYLIFMLLGLMLGLANENTAAIDAWSTKTVILSKGANVNLNQSLIKTADLPPLKAGDSLVGQSPVVISRQTGATHKQSAQLIGLRADQPIYQHLELVSGHRPQKPRQVVLAANLRTKGYRLGDRIKLAGQKQSLTVVGFAKDGMLNMTPIVYGNLQLWQAVKGGPQFAASAIFSQRTFQLDTTALKAYPRATYVNKLPGYTAQNKTFAAMIGFLMIISMIIIGVFLYILTMQKLPNYAVLRAQGIPGRTLTVATVSQAAVLMVSGGLLSLLLTRLTMLGLPASMPFQLSWPLAAGLTGALVLLGTVGALIPVKLIQRVQPLDALR
ncbi:ABC transporter permease [Limosilactobacillus ingluviei]|uniref:ABC superfamily ATP binding cassette transporter, membrane protein n=1 Tax=Limosilactobacillus ingluviei DSM 15946 TaxID=1423760 RepID=A0A0R1UEB0_9LACO|nr:ABC transporter permease [Limosilactobacillus ingluviei]KRL91759.1 ABC superfamily ATP binding cassette transporter, membrane protein [Limosilactobacillus ingluviei DSM 15946]